MTKKELAHLLQSYSIFTGVTEENIRYLGMRTIYSGSGVSAKTFGSDCIGVLKKGYLTNLGTAKGGVYFNVDGNVVAFPESPLLSGNTIELEGIVSQDYVVEANTRFWGLFDVYKIV